ncbi:MAG: cupin domain-containing protein [Gammaproteobacteria bacterium]|nr:cupin domain-containing protein [Gammaproteobacteria bacterium]
MSKKTAQIVILQPNEGRHYSMGNLSSVFKADDVETNGKYSISEWWLEPYTKGPGIHSHENEDDVFYVLEGIMSIFINGEWVEAPKGAFVLAPGGVPHDFENRSAARAGVLNFSIPGNFEKNMPAIVNWFNYNPQND